MLGEWIKILQELNDRWRWSNKADRLGPDMIATYFKFFVPSLQKKICKKKFKHFGENAEFRIGAYAVGCSNISIGDNVIIRPNSMLMATESGDIQIEKDVLIGSGVHIYVSNHKYEDRTSSIYYQGHSPAKSVLLKEGCWIGANVIILPGVTIGKNSVVAAGSIVTKNVMEYTVVGGKSSKSNKRNTLVERAIVK